MWTPLAKVLRHGSTILSIFECPKDNVSTSVFGNDSCFFALIWILGGQFDLEDINRFLDELINLTCDENGRNSASKIQQYQEKSTDI